MKTDKDHEAEGKPLEKVDKVDEDKLFAYMKKKQEQIDQQKIVKK